MKDKIRTIDAEIRTALEAYDRAFKEQERCGLYIRKLVNTRCELFAQLCAQAFEGIEEDPPRSAVGISNITWPSERK